MSVSSVVDTAKTQTLNAVQTAKTELKALPGRVETIALKAIVGFSELLKDTSAFYATLKFSVNALSAFTLAFNPSFSFAGVIQKFSAQQDLMDAFEGFSGLDYVVNNKKAEHTPLKAAANYLFFGAAIGSVGIFAQQIGLANFSSVSSLLSKVPLAGVASQLTLGQATTGLAAVAFALLTVDSARKLVDPDNKDDKKKLMLDLAHSVTEVALCTALLTRQVNQPGLLALGMAAGALGMASHLYGNKAFAAVKQA